MMAATCNEYTRTPAVVPASVLVAVLALATGPAMGADAIDPDADKILRSMSTYMAGLGAFSVSADIDVEVIDLQGQKLQFSSSGDLLLVRPGQFYSRRHVPTMPIATAHDRGPYNAQPGTSNASFMSA